jgi:hypothetical protein
MNNLDELKYVISAIRAQLHQLSPFFRKNKEKIGSEFLDANLTRVAPKCHDMGRVAYLCRGTFGHSAYCQNL